MYLDKFIVLFQGANAALLAWWTVVLFFSRQLGIYPYADKHPVNPLRYWMGALALGLTMGYLLSLLQWGDALRESARFLNFLVLFDMCMVPVCGLLLVRLSHAYRITLKAVVINTLPFVLFMVANIIWLNPLLKQAAFLYMALYCIVTFVIILISSMRYEQRLQDMYATTYGRSLRWLWVMVALFVVQMSLWTYFAVHRHPAVMLAYYAFSIFSWNFLMINLFRMLVTAEASVEQEWQDEEENEDDDELLIEFEKHPIPLPKSGQEDNLYCPRCEEFLRLLDEVCVKGELYTTEDLTRDMLARKMNIGHTQLTEMLHRTTGKTFYEYINALRTQKAAELLTTTQLDAAAIGFDVGYRYRSTFYRAFQAQYGCTPTEYRERKKM